MFQVNPAIRTPVYKSHSPGYYVAIGEYEVNSPDYSMESDPVTYMLHHLAGAFRNNLEHLVNLIDAYSDNF